MRVAARAMLDIVEAALGRTVVLVFRVEAEVRPHAVVGEGAATRSRAGSNIEYCKNCHGRYTGIEVAADGKRYVVHVHRHIVEGAASVESSADSAARDRRRLRERWRGNNWRQRAGHRHGVGDVAWGSVRRRLRNRCRQSDWPRGSAR